MPLPEETGETLHPLSYVGGRQHRLRLLGKEAAHQPHEPGVVFGMADQPAQARRGCNCHRSTSIRRCVAAA